MATAFDGLGLGMLGMEKNYMQQENPLKLGLQGLKNAGIVIGMEKSGLIDFLNKVGEQKQSILDKYPNLNPNKQPVGAVPPVAPAPIASTPVSTPAPVTNATVDNQSMPTIADDAAMNVFNPVPITAPVSKPNNVDTETITPTQTMPSLGNVGVSPDILQQRNSAEDQTALQVAAMPPPQMNLPQYGRQGGGINPVSVISTLASLFA